MQSITKSELDTLIKLQVIETESGKIHARLAGVSDKIDELEKELSGFAQRIHNEQDQLDTLKKDYRSHESDVEMNLSKIVKSQERLRSVKTNKEYQSMLKEIDDIKAMNSEIEDKMIECLDKMESVEEFLSGKQDELKALEDSISQEKTMIQEESAADKKQLAELEAEWNQISGEVSPGLLNTYKTIRDKRGMAIVAAINSVCQGCHLNIPPQMYNELQRCDSLTFCPHCQRIIYWKNTIEQT